jgi:glycosyltransferase involved in cell wall biosynthesis
MRAATHDLEVPQLPRDSARTSQLSERAPRLIFLHITKTAGTTLRGVLKGQYGSNAIFTVDGEAPRQSLDEFASLEPARRDALRAFVGHMTFGLHEALPQPTMYVTLLRDPLERIVSHYYYVLRTPESRLYDLIASGRVGLREYAERFPYAHNGQTRVLGGTLFSRQPEPPNEETLAAAKRNLSNHFLLAGLAERFDETILLLRRALGWRWPFYVNRNVTRGRPSRDEIPQDAIRVIEELNRLDTELYDWAADRFENVVRDQGPGFSRALAAFRELNRAHTGAQSIPSGIARQSGHVEWAATDRPTLSVIVISRNDRHRIERTLRSVVMQECSEPFEVIVVVSGTDGTAEIVRREFPRVRLVELDRPALPGEARNAGLRFARGRYVSFPGSHVELSPGSLAARLRAHGMGYAMVTGTMLNGTRTWSGWAAYFLDHSTALPGRPAEVLDEPPAHCSYLHAALLEVGGFPEGVRAGEDTAVNAKLHAGPYAAYRLPDVKVVHHNLCTNPVKLVRHHFGRGRGFGRLVVERRRSNGRSLGAKYLAWLLLGYVPRRLRQKTAHVRAWGGDLRPVYWRAFPLVVLGVLGAWVGLLYELLRSGRGVDQSELGSPGRSARIRKAA